MRNNIREKLKILISEHKINIAQVSEIVEKERLAQDLIKDIDDLFTRIEDFGNA